VGGTKIISFIKSCYSFFPKYRFNKAFIDTKKTKQKAKRAYLISATDDVSNE